MTWWEMWLKSYLWVAKIRQFITYLRISWENCGEKKSDYLLGAKVLLFFFLLKVLYLIKLLQFVVHHTSMLQTAANKYVVRTERGFKNCIVSSSFTHLSMCTLFFFPNILVVVQMWLLKSVTKKGFMVFDFPSCPNPSPAHNVRRSPVGEA